MEICGDGWLNALSAVQEVLILDAVAGISILR